MLRARGKFYTSDLEKQVVNNFKEFIDKNINN